MCCAVLCCVVLYTGVIVLCCFLCCVSCYDCAVLCYAEFCCVVLCKKLTPFV